MEIYLDGGHWIMGEYTIAGNYDDGYIVWKTNDGEYIDMLFESKSFEECVTWCWNS